MCFSREGAPSAKRTSEGGDVLVAEEIRSFGEADHNGTIKREGFDSNGLRTLQHTIFITDRICLRTATRGLGRVVASETLSDQCRCLCICPTPCHCLAFSACTSPTWQTVMATACLVTST